MTFSSYRDPNPSGQGTAGKSQAWDWTDQLEPSEHAILLPHRHSLFLLIHDSAMNNNSVAFPTVSTSSRPTETTSLISYAAHRATAVEVCDLVYGPAVPSWSAVERFYEADATYENPIVTATSRSVIADIHALSGRLAQLDIPRPVALLQSLFGISRDGGFRDSWFKAMSMWNEVTDVSESESYGEY